MIMMPGSEMGLKELAKPLPTSSQKRVKQPEPLQSTKSTPIKSPEIKRQKGTEKNNDPVRIALFTDQQDAKVPPIPGVHRPPNAEANSANDLEVKDQSTAEPMEIDTKDGVAE